MYDLTFLFSFSFLFFAFFFFCLCHSSPFLSCFVFLFSFCLLFIPLLQYLVFVVLYRAIRVLYLGRFSRSSACVPTWPGRLYIFLIRVRRTVATALNPLRHQSCTWDLLNGEKLYIREREEKEYIR